MGRRSPQQPQPAAEGLYRRLVWMTLLRIALVTLLLAASALVLLHSDAQDIGRVQQVLYAIILGSYLASLVYLYFLRRAPAQHRRLAYAQVSGDVVIAACLIYLTGGAESIIVFMFPLTVVSAAVLLYRRGAMVAAGLSSLALVTVVLGLNLGLLPAPTSRLVPSMPADRLAFFLFANIAAIFLTAALASYLSEQARTAHERLSVRENDYYALELLHESIVRSVPSGIIAVDRFGLVRFLNRAAEHIAHLDAAAVLGTPLEAHLHGVAEQLSRAERVGQFEADHVILPGGERRRLRCARSPLLDRDGRDHGYVLALEDLTDIRSMEEAVKRAERLAAIGAMAAGLAHELRNPLASMSGSIQLLSDSRVFSADEERLMGIVLREADRLNGLVREFLQYARPAPAQLEPLDLRAVVDSTVTLFRNDPSRRAVQVELELEAPLPVLADPGQIGQVLWNLLANAAEAMPRGGRVFLSGRRCDGGASVQLAVRDEGAGIAPEDLAHVFEPFFTTKEHGTGLGLATVHSIVLGHGGEVAVESTPGAGATFSVKLPLHLAAADEAAAARAAAGHPSGARAGGGRRGVGA